MVIVMDINNRNCNIVLAYSRLRSILIIDLHVRIEKRLICLKKERILMPIIFAILCLVFKACFPLLQLLFSNSNHSL